MSAPSPRWPLRALMALVVLLQFALFPAWRLRLELFVPLMVALGLFLPRHRLTGTLGGLGLARDLFGGASLGVWTLFGIGLAALFRGGRATLIREAPATQAVLGAFIAMLMTVLTTVFFVFKGAPLSWGAVLARIGVQAVSASLVTPLFSALVRRLVAPPPSRFRSSHGLAR